MTLDDLLTPCLVLDQRILKRNLDIMARAVSRHGVTLRPHMKTAKSIEVARLACGGGKPGSDPNGITVSTLAEAEYFVGHGITDILYAVAITPQKLIQIAKLNATGANVMVVTDDPDVAGAIAAQDRPPRTLIEIDTGEGRSGITADNPVLLEIAARLGPALVGVMTHAGHSYNGRSSTDMARFAEAERLGAVRAAERLNAAGHSLSIVSVGSSPTALYAQSLAGVTEVRAGVYMFGDLFQAEIGTHSPDDIAVTVLASVIGRRPNENRLVIDAGGIALSKDRSTQAAPHDFGYGLMLDVHGRRSFGRSLVTRAYQEHGVVELDTSIGAPLLPVGAKVRVAPNHTCMMAAAHDRYFVVEGSDSVVGIWQRVNGW
jgi:D-serine deaminase-like pyridoxal phosphate-dependent protein